jgi:ribose 5-phosphate isomerase A
MEQTNKDTNQTMKKAAANAAVETLVKSGMKLGLGTGSTAIHAVRRIGELLMQGTLKDICAFATSLQTELECEKFKIPSYSLNSYELREGLDLTIDGADEVDVKNYLTKGGGGALLIEKIAAYASDKYAIVVDETKIVTHLGLKFPVPMEVIPAARVQVTRALEKMGAEVILREGIRKAGPVITDNGNLILDVRFGAPVDPASLETELNMIPGLIENGFFTRKKPVVFIALSSGTVTTR